MESEQLQVACISAAVVLGLHGCLWLNGMFMSYSDIQVALNHTPSSFIQSLVVWSLVAFCTSFFFLRLRIHLTVFFGLVFMFSNWYTFGFRSVYDTPCVTGACVWLVFCLIGRLLFVHVIRHRMNQAQNVRNFPGNQPQQADGLQRHHDQFHLAGQHRGAAAENVRDPEHPRRQPNFDIRPILQQLIQPQVPVPLPAAPERQLQDIRVFRRAAVPEETVIGGSNAPVMYPSDFEDIRSVNDSLQQRPDELGLNVHSMPVRPLDSRNIHPKQPERVHRNVYKQQQEEQQKQNR